MKIGRLMVWAVGMVLWAAIVSAVCESLAVGQTAFLFAMLAGALYTLALTPWLLRD